MFESRPLSRHRLWTFHLLRRTQRFHSPIANVSEIDVTDTLAKVEALRAEGHGIGFTAVFARATALTILAHPRLNRRIFHGLFGRRQVSFDHITCAMVAERTDDRGELIVLPMKIRNIDQCSVEDIHARIRAVKQDPLDSVEGYQAVKKVHSLPRFLVPLIHFLYRSQPGLIDRGFSTYALSSVVVAGAPTIAGTAPANQTTFCPFNLKERAEVVEGKVVPRMMLSVGISVDHYLVDGLELQRAAITLEKLLQDPDRLLALPVSSEGQST
jgi:pyruvate/2-oxoglutarate dehydrogenase complex dihydrolipoamide acyltransferase (E2) component